MNPRTDLYIGLATLAACAALWLYLIPVYAPGENQSLFPRLIVAWMATFGVLLTIFSTASFWMSGRTAKEGEQGGDRDASSAEEPARLGYVAGLILLWIPYIVLLGYLGFYVSGGLMLVASMFYLGVRDWRRLVATPALAMVLIYLVFEQGLNLVLPRGQWF